MNPDFETSINRHCRSIIVSLWLIFAMFAAFCIYVVVMLLLWVVALSSIARGEIAPNFPPEYHSWLHRQTSPTGIKCCDPGDCFVTAARIRPVAPDSGLSGYQALHGDTWIDIPISALVRGYNPTGEPILCISPTGRVWCFWAGWEI